MTETRLEWEARIGRTLTWDDIACDPTERFACQMCLSEAFDTFDTDGFGHGVGPGTFWTYCRPCDCWTEHPPTY